MNDSITRKTLFRWTAWFALANALVFGLVSLRYFGGNAPAETGLAWIYLVSVYIGHHVLLTAVPMFLLGAPLIVILPRRRLLEGDQRRGGPPAGRQGVDGDWIAPFFITLAYRSDRIL